MASKRDRRQQVKREKQRKKRAAAQTSRSLRTRGSRQATDWPISEAWISSNWHEQGAYVHGMLTRTSPSGMMAAALFEVDLAGDGLRLVKAWSGAQAAEIQGELARRSTDDVPMHVTEPPLVAKLAREGAVLTERAGRPLPGRLADALRLFPDVDPDASPHRFDTGDPLADAATDETPKPGLWSSLKRRVGLS